MSLAGLCRSAAATFRSILAWEFSLKPSGHDHKCHPFDLCLLYQQKGPSLNIPAHVEFRNLSSTLCDENPKAYHDAVARSEDFVPISRSTADDIWKALWPQPLYANASQPVAQKWREILAPSMNGAWRSWGVDPSVFQIHHIAPGISNKCFKVEGDQADRIRETSSISLHRLYRIQSAASALRSRAAIAAYPFDDVILQNFKGVEGHIRSLKEEFGQGWGLAPILNFLAEFGESVRPNNHLMRTMNHLRPGRGLPVDHHLTSKQAAKLNHHVWLLILDMGHSHITPHEVRRMDYLLCEISKCGLIGEQAETAVACATFG